MLARADFKTLARAVHPKPYTLCKPYTIHPTPYTLHPTPYALNPNKALARRLLPAATAGLD